MAVFSLQELCTTVVAKHITLFTNLEGLPLHLADAIFDKLAQMNAIDYKLLQLLSSQRCCFTTLPLPSKCTNAWIPLIVQLPWLETLAFHKSVITNKALKDLLPLAQSLRKLVLTGCERIDDEGLALLPRFEQLFELVLSHLPLVTGKRFKGTLHRLESLELSHCPKLVVAPVSCPRLVSLSIDFTALVFPALLELVRRCPRVEKFSARGSAITEWPRELAAGLPSLRELDLAYSRVRSAASLTSHTRLVRLNLSHTLLGDATFALPAHSVLVDLNLAATKISAKALAAVPQTIVSLDISRTNVDESAIELLSTMTRLVSLDVRFSEISVNSAAQLQARLPRCTVLAEEMALL